VPRGPARRGAGGVQALGNNDRSKSWRAALRRSLFRYRRRRQLLLGAVLDLLTSRPFVDSQPPAASTFGNCAATPVRRSANVLNLTGRAARALRSIVTQWLASYERPHFTDQGSSLEPLPVEVRDMTRSVSPLRQIDVAKTSTMTALYGPRIRFDPRTRRL